MSVVAWDGKTVAADKQSTNGNRAVLCTKVRELEDGTVLAAVGDHEESQILMDWYCAGGVKEDWPAFQKDESFTTLIIINSKEAYQYQAYPRLQRIEAGFFAWGDGAPVALGAMAAGADARRAVEITCEYNIFCGQGITVCNTKKGEK